MSGKNRSSTPDPLIATSDDESFDLHNKYGLKESGDSKRTIEDSLIKEGSFNINEIDARLSALQQYMDDLIVNWEPYSACTHPVFPITFDLLYEYFYTLKPVCLISLD